MNSVVSATTADGVLSIVLRRPEVLNAMNVELLTELVAAIDAAADARAVVLSGDGRAFCVGEDLKETLAPRTGSAEELREAFALLQEITRGLTALPCPVVAGVHGFAVGGGAELALAADLIVAHPATRFRFPEVPLGHAVTGGISARLPSAVGMVRAKELLLTGRWFTGEEAYAMGMLTELSDTPVERAHEWARELAQHPRRSLAATKSGLEMAALGNQEAVMRAEIDAAAYCFSGAEAQDAYEPFQTGSRSA